MIRIGLVDFDTSHVAAFTQRFNHTGIDAEHWVQGAKVTAGCPGDSVIMPERIPGYAEQLQGWGVQLLDRPEELLPLIDAVMITSQQGSRHLERARPFLQAGLPVFVDKPFAAATGEADEMIALSRRHDAPLMSCSALRYAPEVIEAQRLTREYGPVVSVDAWTTAVLHPGNPGLLHYGIHGVEMLYALMGPGCRTVRCLAAPEGDVSIGEWPEGRLGTLRGIRKGQGGFGFTAHYERGHYSAVIEGAAFYTGLLQAVMELFERRVESIDLRETREIIAFIAAAAASAAGDARPAPLG